MAENEKGVKGWGQRDGQLRVMAYISHSLFNESHIDRAITPHTHAQIYASTTLLQRRVC